MIARIINLILLLGVLDRWLLLMVCLLMSLVAFLDVVGVSLIIPLMSLLIGENSRWQLQIFHHFPNINHDHFGAYVLLVFLVYFFLKTCIVYFCLNFQNNFFTNLYAKHSCLVIKNYLMKPLSECYKEDRATIMNNATELANVLGRDFLYSFIVIVSECFFIFSLVTFLLWFQPMVTLVLIAMAFIVLLVVVWLYRGKMHAISQQHHLVKVQRDIAVDNALRGLAEVKAYGAVGYCIIRLEYASSHLAKVLKKYRILTQFPRSLIELLTISGFCLVMLLSFVFNSATHSVTLLAVFAAAAMRFLPSVSKIMHAFQNLGYGSFAYDQIGPELSKETVAQSVVRDQPVISLACKNLSFCYGKAKHSVFKDVNLELGAKKFLAITGKSGCGKSTLAKILVGLLKPASGELLVNGDLVNCLAGFSICYVPQELFIAEGTLAENIAFGKEIVAEQIVQVLKLVGLQEITSQWPEGINAPIGDHGVRLSGGQKQRLGIARALYRRPSFLILDEALSGLDELSEKKLFSELRVCDFIHLAIFITHRASTVALCDDRFSMEAN